MEDNEPRFSSRRDSKVQYSTLGLPLLVFHGAKEEETRREESLRTPSNDP